VTGEVGRGYGQKNRNAPKKAKKSTITGGKYMMLKVSFKLLCTTDYELRTKKQIINITKRQ